MKNWKKGIAAVVFSAVMAVTAARVPEGIFKGFDVSISADDYYKETEDGFIYYLNEYDNYAEVLAYNGTKTDIVVPSAINGIPVRLMSGAFSVGGDMGSYKNNSIKSVVLPDGITNMSYCFQNCNDLTSVVLPGTINSIRGSFVNCAKLQKIDLPEGLNELYYSFRSCTSLKTVTLPNSLTSLDYEYNYSFSGCTGLTDIFVKDGNENFSSIDGILYKPAFWKGIELIIYPEGKKKTSFTLPADVTAVNEIDPAHTLKTISVEEGNTTYSSIDGVLFKNDYNSYKLIHYPADRKGDSYVMPKNTTEFKISYCKNLKKLTVNAGAKYHTSSITNCEKLTDVYLPSDIEEDAFSNIQAPFDGCNSLKNIKIDDNSPYFKTIDGALFDKNGTKLIAYPFGKATKQKAVIPDNTKTMSYNLFFENDYIKEVVIPDSVESFDYDDSNNVCYLFQNSSIEKIELSSCLTSIPNDTFLDCKNLKTITIPGSVRTIGQFAFYGCTSLSEVTIGEGVEIIGHNAFFGDFIKKLTLPISLTEMEDMVFGYGGKIGTSIVIDDIYYAGSEEDWYKIKGIDKPQKLEYGSSSYGTSGISPESNIHFNSASGKNVIVNGKGYDTLEEAMKELSKATGDIRIELNDNVSAKKLTLPKSASSVIIVGNGYTLNVPSISASCDITLENITIKTAKGTAAAVTAKKALTVTGCTLGAVKASAALSVTDGTYESINASGKAGTTTTLGGTIVITKALTVNNDLVVRDGADITVNGKFTPKGTMSFGAIKAFTVKNTK